MAPGGCRCYELGVIFFLNPHSINSPNFRLNLYYSHRLIYTIETFKAAIYVLQTFQLFFRIISSDITFQRASTEPLCAIGGWSEETFSLKMPH